MLNLTQLKIDVQQYKEKDCCVYTAGGYGYNASYQYKHYLEFIEKEWGMTLAQMEQAIAQEEARRNSQIFWFSNFRLNEILRDCRKIHAYCYGKRGYKFELYLEYSFNKLFPNLIKSTRQHKDNWYYGYQTNEVKLDQLMVYFTFYRSTGGSFKSAFDRDYVCGVAETRINEPILREIHTQLVRESKYRATMDYEDWMVEEKQRRIEAFRLKQIYG